MQSCCVCSSHLREYSHPDPTPPPPPAAEPASKRAKTAGAASASSPPASLFHEIPSDATVVKDIDQLKRRLRLFYARHKPAKLESVDEIAERYLSKQDELDAKLASLYGEDTRTIDAAEASGTRDEPAAPSITTSTAAAASSAATKSVAIAPEAGNGRLADIFEEMGAIQKLKRDRFRAKAYAEAARTLRAHPSAILDGAEAKALEGIGAGMARRIDIVLATGELAELQELKKDKDVISMRELRSVRACMCTHVYMHMHMHVHVHASAHAHVHTRAHAHTRTRTLRAPTCMGTHESM